LLFVVGSTVLVVTTSCIT